MWRRAYLIVAIALVALLLVFFLIRSRTSSSESDSTVSGEVPPIQWVTIEAGEGMMGAPDGETGRASQRETLHRVILTHGFQIQTTEVTQDQFQEVMGYNSPRFIDCGPRCPVERVTWSEAVSFCNGLSLREGLPRCYDCDFEGTHDASCRLARRLRSPYDCEGYRLPTEAEWERAARAGSESATYEGDLESLDLSCHEPSLTLHPIAWVCFNSDNRTHEVGTREPNALGLFDTLGNVWEWCQDWAVDDLGEETVTDPWGPRMGEARVVRGGAFDSRPLSVRAAHRGRVLPTTYRGALGFRVVRTLL